ncbi:hypothetical protein [Chlorobaculum thiosulfatiphilum]|jgi:hypothetical protein|nr:hypothetical protein [Chlorobaculum thiosulfatiphilum]
MVGFVELVTVALLVLALVAGLIEAEAHAEDHFRPQLIEVLELYYSA